MLLDDSDENGQNKGLSLVPGKVQHLKFFKSIKRLKNTSYRMVKI